jgi:hypothetical protein
LALGSDHGQPSTRRTLRRCIRVDRRLVGRRGVGKESAARAGEGAAEPSPDAGRTKDRLENKLHALVCEGRLGLASAQRQEYVLVESKLDSEFGHDQLLRYASALVARDEPNCVLVTLTKQFAHRDESLVAYCSANGLTLLQQRWQEMAPALSAVGDDIAREFVEMLTKERLVMPQALVPDDWLGWNRGAEVLDRLKTMVEEARPALAGIHPGLRSSGRVGLTHRWVYTLMKSPTLELALGFWSHATSEGARRLVSCVLQKQRVSAQKRACVGQRSDLKAARSSDVNSSGSSHAAKWPPFSTSLK